jgi:hypothetical protein
MISSQFFPVNPDSQPQVPFCRMNCGGLQGAAGGDEGGGAADGVLGSL